MKLSSQPWILSPQFDLCFILAPGILVSLLAWIGSAQISQVAAFPGWLWLVLIVGVDAGHVYSTLFRTYLDRAAIQRQSALLTLTPVFAWLTGTLLYNMDALLFWRVLAYVALFHFIRQQYGFMMIYRRNEREWSGFYKKIDQAAIYLATLYPILFWHCHGRAFNWFIDGDFLRIPFTFISLIFGWLYFAVLVVYVGKESMLYRQSKTLNLPRNLMLLGTGLSWYVGIVAFDNDLIFTATNVIAHGVPYYALIWAYGYQKNRLGSAPKTYVIDRLKKLFSPKASVIYVAVLFGIAFVEEGVWDGLIWREHQELFGFFDALPAINSPQILSWLVPLLALPQATHYLLDAFIWRLNQPDTEWKNILFRR